MVALLFLVAVVFTALAVYAFLRGAAVAMEEEPRDNVVDFERARFVHDRMKSAANFGRQP